jgi:hypothetical protein
MWKEILILVLVIYLVSRVLRFLLPVFRISSAATEHMRKMQQQMNDMQNQMNQPPPKKNVKKKGDYIDYEDVS